MMIKIIFGLFLVSSALAQTNFSSYLKGSRVQGKIGTCHIFAAVALIEAEWAREFNEKKDFSEAHLTVRHVFGKNEVVAKDRYEEALDSRYSFPYSNQGGFIHLSFKLAQEVGLLEQKETNYREVHSTIDEINLRLQTEEERKSRFFQNFEKKLKSWYGQWQGRHQEWLRGLRMSRFSQESHSREEMTQILKNVVECRPAGMEIYSKAWNLDGSHGVAVIGYNPDKKVFLLRNSWGKAGIFTNVEKMSEEKVLQNIKSVTFIENPAVKCF